MKRLEFPPAGFYYEVYIDGRAGTAAAFQEVSGIEVSAEMETISEAGLNMYSHRVPKRTTYNNLVLKRGLLLSDSYLHEWVRSSLQSNFGEKISPGTVYVSLMDSDGVEVMGWSFVNAYPVKWSVSGFNSMESGIVVESIEFAYNYWEMI
jgi:phage tail-like protein